MHTQTYILKSLSQQHKRVRESLVASHHIVRSTELRPIDVVPGVEAIEVVPRICGQLR